MNRQEQQQQLQLQQPERNIGKDGECSEITETKLRIHDPWTHSMHRHTIEK